VVAAVIVLGPERSAFGPLKWTDLVHLYTIGSVARAGDAADLYDAAALYKKQIELVPASTAEHYLPVYPPQTALLFWPLTHFSYAAAGLILAGINVLVYVGAIWFAWSPRRDALPDRRLLIAGAAAFPPFWNLVLHGQTTSVLVAAFVLALAALEKNHRFLAGFALGLLAIKPQWGLVLAVVTLASAEWAMIAGAVTSVGLQLLAVAGLLGTSALGDYVPWMITLPQITAALQPRPSQMHSLTTLLRLVPGWPGMALVAALSLGIVACAVLAWRTRAPISARLGIVIVATALVNPHVTVYDLTILAPALIWLGGWIQTEGETLLREWFWKLVYALFLFVLMPTARVIPLQVSVVILTCLCALVTRSLVQHHKSAAGFRMIPGGATAA
jgi:hypothetical protein